ncbi:MAG: hypothetical protein ACXIVQ_05385 [Acidimicrobiales bacterium]
MRWRDDRGQVAGIEVLPFGFLIFVVGALLLANAWAVVDAKFAVTAAAREATRIYVESSDPQTADARAREAATAVAVGHGRDASDISVVIVADHGFTRCGVVSSEVTVVVPSLTLPFIGGFGRRFSVRATHTERIDPYRSGLTGTAACD